MRLQYVLLQNVSSLQDIQVTVICRFNSASRVIIERSFVTPLIIAFTEIKKKSAMIFRFFKSLGKII